MKHISLKLITIALTIILLLPSVIFGSDGFVYTVIYDQSNHRVYENREPYKGDSPKLVGGMHGMYHNLLHNQLYENAQTALNSTINALAAENLMMFDLGTSGMAVRMMPPYMIGNNIIYQGHLAGEKVPYVADCEEYNYLNGIPMYDKLTCCNKTNCGMLITMNKDQLNLQKPNDAHAFLLSSAVYHAEFAIPNQAAILFAATKTASPQPERFHPLSNTNQWRARFSSSDEITLNVQSYVDHRTTGLMAEYGHLYGKLGMDHRGSQIREPPIETVDPLSHAPLGYFHEQYRGTPVKKLLAMYKQYEYPGFRAYLRLQPEYRKHIAECYYELTHKTALGILKRAWSGCGYFFGRRTNKFHVGHIIRHMYHEMQACISEEERLKKQKEQNDIWEISERKNIVSEKVSNQSESSPNNAHTTTTKIPFAHPEKSANTPDETIEKPLSHDAPLNVNYATGESLMQFMEQANIDFDEFYDFDGENEAQQHLQDTMREYLMRNINDLILPYINEKLNDEDLPKHILQTIFQQSVSVAFNLNRADLTNEGQLLFDLAQEFFELGGTILKKPIYTAQGLIKGCAHPLQYMGDTATGICNLITYAGKAVMYTAHITNTCIKGVTALTLGDTYMSPEEYEEHWQAWYDLQEKVKHNIGVGREIISSVDPQELYNACTGENLLCALKKVNKGADFITKAGAQGSIDRCVLGNVSALGGKLKPLADECRALRTGIRRLEEVELGTPSGFKKTTQSISDRIEKVRDWVKRKTERKVCWETELSTGEIVTIEINNPSTAYKEASKQINGGKNLNALPEAKKATETAIAVGKNTKKLPYLDYKIIPHIDPRDTMEYIDALSKDFFEYEGNRYDIAGSHILGHDIHVKTLADGTIEKELKGGHYFYPDDIAKELGVTLEVIEVDPVHGVPFGNIWFEGEPYPKTWFPPHWTKAQIMQAIKEAANDPNRKIDKSGLKLIIAGYSKEGLPISTVYDPNQQVAVSAYPNRKILFPHRTKKG